ncbi:uncharacterized protein CTRU02_201948 [Colletotrichum truncatum]|uniref:Uncharacterized protein n=1 Tax=Colletotrichum truncatum TaxID=5467 RepID=A0ACC3ZIV8_COLTU
MIMETTDHTGRVAPGRHTHPPHITVLNIQWCSHIRSQASTHTHTHTHTHTLKAEYAPASAGRREQVPCTNWHR